jgi:hypothetical protein
METDLGLLDLDEHRTEQAPREHGLDRCFYVFLVELEDGREIPKFNLLRKRC